MAKAYMGLHFDDQGNLLDAIEQEIILTSLLDTDRPLTDLWLFAHGWNTSEESADATYDTWVKRMQERIEQEHMDTAYHPAFVGIYWPSLAWASGNANIARQVPPPISPMVHNMEPGEFELDTVPFERDNAEHGLGDVNEVTSSMFSLPIAFKPRGQARFIEAYRAAMDPRGEHGQHYDQDFARLYEVMWQTQRPTPSQIEEFVQILSCYKVDDPHCDPSEIANILDAPERVAASLNAEFTPSLSSAYEGFPTENILLSFFRVFTFWTMKGRAAIIGQNGVATFLWTVKKTLQQYNRNVRLHLFGHSFGAKLVSATVYSLADKPDMKAPLVNTLILLLGAFSQYSFSNHIPIEGGGTGRYATLIDRHFVANPIVAIYSRYDLANKEMYTLGMRLADPSKVYEIQDRFGAIGANGAQGLDATFYRDLEMQPLERSYNWSTLIESTCLNIDGQRFINADKNKRPAGSHGDFEHPEIFHLSLAISRQ